MKPLRLFIAVPLPRQLCEQLSRACRETIADRHRISWVRPEAMHLTLRFLGDTGPAELDRLKSLLGQLTSRHNAGELLPGVPGVFRQRRLPRVLWWGLAGELPLLEQLAADLEQELQQAGFPPADKPFRPHLTLGRVREGTAELADDFLKMASPVQSAIPLDCLQLIASTLLPTGARYRVISSHPLKTSAAAG